MHINQNKALLHFFVEGKETTREVKYKIEIEKTVCPSCSRLSGNYYEAILQLRGDPYKVLLLKESVEKALARKGVGITKAVKLKEGIDLYITSSKALLELVRERGYKVKLSRKLHGLKEGKRVYRLTIALRV